MKFSFSREPAVWIGLATAVLDACAAGGVVVPDNLRAAVVAVITALGAVLIRSQVTPAKGAGFAVSASVTAHPKKTPAKKR